MKTPRQLELQLLAPIATRWSLALVFWCCFFALTSGFAHAQADVAPPATGEAAPVLVDFRRAVPGWKYAWPRDHALHPEFKTEWWYFTGHLRTADGRRFGYQLTFFRQGVRPPGSPAVASRFVVNDLKFGHFTITDQQSGTFLYAQQLTRGAFGEAGFGDGVKEPRLAWLGPWSLTLERDGSFRILARESESSLTLRLEAAKPWATHGENGVSVKAEDATHASHYYSGTRLRASGSLTQAGQTLAVEGESWFDHEWATNQLAANQAGWDWFSLQFDDGTELMLYRLRRKDGTTDPASSGSFIAADGTVRHLRREELEFTPTRMWKSPQSGASYPLHWKVRVPVLEMEFDLTTPQDRQELVLQPVTYWEGMVEATGKRVGKAVKANGYLELTGYAGPVSGLSAPVK